MQLLFFISCLVLLLYVAMIIAFWVGWQRIPNFMPEKKLKQTPRVSLVICCRNEEQNLPSLLASISSQSYKNFEVIFANDHSTDQTAELLAKYAKQHRNVSVFVPQQIGKKNAFREAIDGASGELICCTDADCLLSEKHIETFVDYYNSTHADMILGGVRMCYESSMFEALQALEFLSLQASTIGAVGLGCPIMCNGANVAFTKAAWKNAKEKLCMKTPSGDDEFLLFALKKMGGKIRFVKNEETIVSTKVCSTLNEFFHQRSRWTSKSLYYNDMQTIVVGLLVFFSVLVILLWGICSCFSVKAFYVCLLLFFTKFAIDTFFMYKTLPFFAERKLCRFTLVLSLLYPIYVVSSLLGGFFVRKRWKNRFFR